MADSEPAKRPRRRLRPSETVRERAERVQEESTKPSRRLKIQSTAAAAAAKPARGLAKVFNRQPFRWTGKILARTGRIIFPRYFVNSWRELRLVTWPDGKQTRQLTFAVLMFAVLFGALVAIVDYGLDKLFKEVILK